MRVGIVIENSIEVEKQSSLMIEIRNSIKKFFSTKDFGKGIQCLVIAVIYVHPSFDYINRIRKPKYRKSKGELGYDIQLEYAICEKASDLEFKKIVVEELIKSLDVIDNLNIKDFDLKAFKKEWVVYLNEKRYE